ncbi:MAG: hypothetical protein ACRESR_04895, partial [Gammaproteobacteria bacterium]
AGAKSMAVAMVFVKPKPDAARNRKLRDRLARATVCDSGNYGKMWKYLMVLKTLRGSASRPHE